MSVAIKTVDLPDRMACVRGLVCNADRDGNVNISAMVFEGENYVIAYNAMAAQRDELLAALRGVAHAFDSGGLRIHLKLTKSELDSLSEARAALAKVTK